MAWTPTLPAEPPTVPGWWHELETAEQYETRRWVEGIADEVRAERIERLHRRCHELNMRIAGALSNDQWEKIQRRRDERGAHDYHGYLVGSWGARPDVEHRGGGRVLNVR